MGKRKTRTVMENGRNITLKKGESKRKDGMYIFYYYDNNHKRVCITSSTLTGLREKEAALMRDIVDDIRLDKIHITLNDVHREWKKILAVKNNTASGYDWLYDNYARAKLGKRYIKDIKSTEITEYYINLIRERN